jgi:uncharacterized small protein (DUF1192 family)
MEFRLRFRVDRHIRFVQNSGKGGDAMDERDLEPRNRKPDIKNLEVLSIEALEEFIGELESEIERARQEIARKKLARSAADSIFRK